MSALPAPVQRVVDATNSGDHDAFVAAFAVDGVIVDWGKEFAGSSAIAAWDESDNIGRGSRFAVVGAEPDGEAWIATLEVSGGGFNGTSDFRFEIADDLVTRMEITP